MKNRLSDSLSRFGTALLLRRGVCVVLFAALCVLPGCRKRSSVDPVPEQVYRTATLQFDPGETVRAWIYDSNENLLRQLSDITAPQQLILPAGRYRVVAATDDSENYFWSGIGAFSQLRMHLRQTAATTQALPAASSGTRAERAAVATPVPFATTLCELDLTQGDAVLPVTLEERLKQLRVKIVAEADATGQLPERCEIEVSGLSATFCLCHQCPAPGDDIRHATVLAPVASDPGAFSGLMALIGNDADHKSTLRMTVYYAEGWSRSATVVIDEQMEALDTAQKIDLTMAFGSSDLGFSAVITDWEVVVGEFPVQ